MELPPLGSLQTLETLSRVRRVGAAAEELGVSHAAVSQTVSRLERKYGVQLFVRTSWGVVATEAAENLVQAYHSASSILTNAIIDVSRESAFEVLAPRELWNWMTPAISSVRRDIPNLRFNAYQDPSATDFFNADFAIRPGIDHPPSGFGGSALFDERILPVCSPEFARSMNVETAASLARSDLLVVDPALWRSWFSHAGLMFPPSLKCVTFGDEALAMEAALRGQGVALCCSVATAAAVSRAELVAPVEISVGSGRRWWATWKHSNHLEPAMRLLECSLALLNSTKTPHVTLVEAR